MTARRLVDTYRWGWVIAWAVALVFVMIMIKLITSLFQVVVEDPTLTAAILACSIMTALTPWCVLGILMFVSDWADDFLRGWFYGPGGTTDYYNYLDDLWELEHEEELRELEDD